MKITKVIEIVLCDFCAKEANGKCELCGKDICMKCSRWICHKKYAPISGGPCFTWLGASYSYAPYPWEWHSEKLLCKDCVEQFKMSIATLVGKKNEGLKSN